MRTVFTFKSPAFYFIIFSFLVSCIKPKTHIKPDDLILYLDDNSTAAKTELVNYFSSQLEPQSQVNIKECSCDNKLIKLSGPKLGSRVFGGAGSPIQTKPTGGVGGDLIAKFADIPTGYIANYEPNIIIEAPEINRIKTSKGPVIIFPEKPDFLSVDNNSLNFNNSIPTTTIAILDAGLPTNVLNQNLPFIWKNAAGESGWNFISNTSDIKEDINPHSNNVVAFLTSELKKRGIENVNLMMLKVLDEKNQGDYFDILCAILFAYKNNASILNLSLGYYGQSSVFFEKFLEAKNFKDPSTGLPYTHNRWIVTAAGNIDTQADFLENIFHKRDLTNRKNKFYPTFFANDFKNVFSITSIENLENVASNQNYSRIAVDMGVKTDNALSFDINGHLFTGSSYAAPIFTSFVAQYFNAHRDEEKDKNKAFGILDVSPSSEIKIGVGLTRQIIEGKYILRKN